jgi:membrane-associated protein
MHYLIDLITAFGDYGYLVLFIIIFLESFPLTFFLPGDSLLFTTGFLASQNLFNMPILVVVLFSGSFFGYMFSYFMGKKIRDFILNSNDQYWFKKKHLDYTDEFFKKYGGKTIIIGRFVPIVRSFAPTLAGAAKMDYKKFIYDSLLGAFLWSFGITMLGYYLGKIFPGAHKFLTPIILFIIILSLTPSILQYLKHRRNTLKTKENGTNIS